MIKKNDVRTEENKKSSVYHLLSNTNLGKQGKGDVLELFLPSAMVFNKRT